MGSEIEPKPLPRPVEVHGHQIYYKALCIALSADHALIEDKYGRTDRLDLKMYHLKFTDRE